MKINVGVLEGTKKVLSSRWNVKVLKKGETLGDKARSDFTESTVSFVDQPLQETVARRKLIRHILKQIADKTGFLLESNLKQVLEPYCEDKSMLVKLDNVFAVSVTLC